MQMADQDGADLVGVDPLLAQGGHRGGTAVEQHRGRCRRLLGERDAGLVATS
jgi:hypothetical protein